MKYIVLLGALMLAFTTSANAVEGDRAQIIAAIKAKAIDPDSVRVNGIMMLPPVNGKKGACATVNAKNRLGGDTGNQSMTVYYENGRWRAGAATPYLTCEDIREMRQSEAM
jgi:hypothetical protein